MGPHFSFTVMGPRLLMVVILTKQEVKSGSRNVLVHMWTTHSYVLHTSFKFIFTFVCSGSLLLRVGSLIMVSGGSCLAVVHRLLLQHVVLVALSHVRSLFPDQGSNSCPLQLAGRFLTNGPSGRSHTLF